MENASDRLPVWEAAAQRFGEHPILGFGPRTFRSVFQDVDKLTDKGISSWHNETIQIYMESGALGLASFFFLIGFLVFLSVRLIRSKVAGLHGFRPGWAGVLLVMGLLIVGLFGTPAVSITNAMLFRFLMALIAVEYMRMPKAQTQEGQ
jgi:O-antigen ligase